MSHYLSTNTSQASSDPLTWKIQVERCAVWTENPDNPIEPDIKFVDSSLRRKLSPLARITLKVAHECAGDIPAVHLVYASQHGDIQRISHLLIDLAKDETPSPTAFSMSVLNATAGAYSIARQDTSPSTAISAARSTFGFGLLEASMQLAASPGRHVLYVYADEAPPAMYSIHEKFSVRQAIGVLLSTSGDTGIVCTMTGPSSESSSYHQSQSFLNCLQSHESTVWHGEGRTWGWSRC